MLANSSVNFLSAHLFFHDMMSNGESEKISLRQTLKKLLCQKGGFVINVTNHCHLSFDHLLTCPTISLTIATLPSLSNIRPDVTAPVLVLLNSKLHSCSVEDHLYYYQKISY